jgi:hypothetical protein
MESEGGPQTWERAAYYRICLTSKERSDAENSDRTSPHDDGGLDLRERCFARDDHGRKLKELCARDQLSNCADRTSRSSGVLPQNMPRPPRMPNADKRQPTERLSNCADRESGPPNILSSDMSRPSRMPRAYGQRRLE